MTNININILFEFPTFIQELIHPPDGIGKNLMLLSLFIRLVMLTCIIHRIFHTKC
jgi:hypothetical protein